MRSGPSRVPISEVDTAALEQQLQGALKTVASLGVSGGPDGYLKMVVRDLLDAQVCLKLRNEFRASRRARNELG